MKGETEKGERPCRKREREGGMEEKEKGKYINQNQHSNQVPETTSTFGHENTCRFSGEPTKAR